MDILVTRGRVLTTTFTNSFFFYFFLFVFHWCEKEHLFSFESIMTKFQICFEVSNNFVPLFTGLNRGTATSHTIWENYRL